jgi:zinc transporter ZupT
MSYGLVYPLFVMLIFRQDSVFLASVSDAMRGFWLGVLIAASPLGQFFTSPILGAVSDQIGRKPTLQISYLIIVIGFGLHNATEGFGIVAPMAADGERPSVPFLIALGFIGGAPTFIGTIMGSSFVNDAVFLGFLALAAGSIVLVAR